MFESFWSNVQYGINHVLDINAYDHVLFLIVLSVPFMFKDWKRILLLVTIFTLGHTLSLAMASYGIISVDGKLVEFLIPMTIMVVALYNVFTAGKKAPTEKIGILFLTTLFFGLIHGLGFANYFSKRIGTEENKLIKMLEFSLGIEIAQIIIVFIVLFLGFLCQTIFRFSRRDWVVVVSAVVVGLVIPMLLHSKLFA
ncbi:MAG: HupE/UreJ family protein [Aquaticitalea sp.]